MDSTSAEKHPAQRAPRLLVLTIEMEQPEGLSSRKLILESMKHNVITAYSGREAIALLARCAVDVALVHSNLLDQSCEELVQRIRAMQPSVLVVSLTPDHRPCGADKVLDSLQPDALVKLFNQLSQERLGKLPAEHPTTRTIAIEEANS